MWGCFTNPTIAETSVLTTDHHSTTTTQESPRIAAETPRNIVACNYCGSKNTHAYCPANGLGLVQCRDCDLVYVGMRPDAEALYRLYEQSYFQNNDSGVVGYTDYIRDEFNIRKTAQRRARHIEQYIQPGKMIDVGCAMGFFIDEMAKRGWQVEGLDVSKFATQYVQQHFGHVASNGSFTDVALAEGAYDLVTMFDVIEHVPDPQAYMRRAAQILRMGGVYELATPDVHSYPARLTGKRWIGYKLSEEHIYYFSVQTLTQMLDAAGFDVVNVRHIGKHVTLNLFLDRLGFYLPWIARPLEWLERKLKLSQRSFYVNPFDIVAITARKR